jgi:hypothetical protein
MLKSGSFAFAVMDRIAAVSDKDSPFTIDATLMKRPIQTDSDPTGKMKNNEIGPVYQPK